MECGWTIRKLNRQEMKKQMILLFLFAGLFQVSAQKYATKTGNLKFEASLMFLFGLLLLT